MARFSAEKLVFLVAFVVAEVLPASINSNMLGASVFPDDLPKKPSAPLEDISGIEKQWSDLTFPSAIEWKRRRGKPFTINVEGILGTGKSTFLKVFKKYNFIDVLPEPVDKWTDLNNTDLLQLIYDNPKRWALAQESYVQLTMLEEHLRKIGAAKVMERSMHSGRYIFVEYLKGAGQLQPVEYEIISRWYSLLNEIPDFDLSTDLTVYLRIKPEDVVDRIRRRGRPEEKHLSMDFLRGIHRLHEDWLFYKNSTSPLPSDKIIVIDTNKPFETMMRIYRSLAKKIISVIPSDVKRVNVISSKSKKRKSCSTTD